GPPDPDWRVLVADERKLRPELRARRQPADSQLHRRLGVRPGELSRASWGFAHGDLGQQSRSGPVGERGTGVHHGLWQRIQFRPAPPAYVPGSAPGPEHDQPDAELLRLVRPLARYIGRDVPAEPRLVRLRPGRVVPQAA